MKRFFESGNYGADSDPVLVSAPTGKIRGKIDMMGYVTTTKNKHYVLTTEKRKVTIYMITAFVRKIAEIEKYNSDWVDAVLHDKKCVAELRKRIDKCRLEKEGDMYTLIIGKPEKPSMIGKFPISDHSIVEFSETFENNKLANIF